VSHYWFNILFHHFHNPCFGFVDFLMNAIKSKLQEKRQSHRKQQEPQREREKIKNKMQGTVNDVLFFTPFSYCTFPAFFSFSFLQRSSFSLTLARNRSITIRVITKKKNFT
jgi:hypothetical protein